jgi:hypothetical protein
MLVSDTLTPLSKCHKGLDKLLFITTVHLQSCSLVKGLELAPGLGIPHACSLAPMQTLARKSQSWRICQRMQGLLLFVTGGSNTRLCAWGEEDSGGHVL